VTVTVAASTLPSRLPNDFISGTASNSFEPIQYMCWKILNWCRGVINGATRFHIGWNGYDIFFLVDRHRFIDGNRSQRKYMSLYQTLIRCNDRYEKLG